MDAKPHGEGQRLGDVSRRIGTTERDIEELSALYERLRERFENSERDAAVYRESIKPWINAVKGLAYALGIAAAGAVIKLVVK